MSLIAIDPGASGGIAWADCVTPVKCVPMPETPGDILTLLRSIRGPAEHVTVYIERIIGFTQNYGMQVLAEQYGYIQGCLDALGFRVIRVPPQQWQKALSIGKKDGKTRADKDASAESKKAVSRQNAAIDRDWKNKLKAEAQRRFPQTVGITLKTADALLLLDYAIKQEWGGKHS